MYGHKTRGWNEHFMQTELKRNRPPVTNEAIDPNCHRRLLLLLFKRPINLEVLRDISIKINSWGTNMETYGDKAAQG